MEDERTDTLELGEGATEKEASIDLNAIYSGEERDLNRLFPDAMVRRFLRDVRKNQRDVERFLKRLEHDGSMPEKSGGGNEVS
jgi:hypothetical protein